MKDQEQKMAAEQPTDLPPEQDLNGETADVENMTGEQLLAEAQNLAEHFAAQKLELEQQHLRLQADFDNYRKRSRQEQGELIKQANNRLVAELLPVLDNMERALAALPDDGSREGVNLICRQLLEVLAQAGLEPIEAIGQDFDPQLHEAIAQIEAAAEQKGKVIAEAQKGYLFHGRLLRPSMVQIGC